MALKIASNDISGVHGAVHRHMPEHVARVTKFYGLQGESEIADPASGRQLDCHIWIFEASFVTAELLMKYLTKLDNNVGKWRGDLIETGNITQTFHDVTFKGFEMQAPGPLPDLTQSLVRNKIVWFCMGTLLFRQHTVGT
jgi:hypothetical protein